MLRLLGVVLLLGLPALSRGEARRMAPPGKRELQELIDGLERVQRLSGPYAQSQGVIRQEVGAARRQLRRAQEGAVALPLALTGVLGNLDAAGAQRGVDPRLPAEVERLRDRIAAVLKDIGAPYPSYAPPPAPGPRAGILVARRGAVLLLPVGLSPSLFQHLLARMQQLAFGDEKLRLARETARLGQPLSCAQIAQLMRTTGLADEQAEIAAALFPLAADPQNLTELVALLQFDDDRDRLRARLSARGAPQR